MESPPVIPNPVPLQTSQPRPIRRTQVTEEEVVYPTIQGPPRVQTPEVRQPSTSSEEAAYLATNQSIYPYYPETIYVANCLPTRNPRELQTFKNHCLLQYNHVRAAIVQDHPLDHARNLTSSPLNFENLLWKTRTTVSFYGIFEEYSWIRRRIRQRQLDQAILQPAYKVHYPWNTDGWTVSRLTRE